MKKKVLAFASASLAALVLGSCGTTVYSSSSSSASEAPHDLFYEEGFDYLTMNNGLLSLTFDKENGSLKSFINMATSTDFVKGSAGGSWSLLIDLSTDDPFLSNPSGASTHLVNSRSQKITYSLDRTDENLSLNFFYNVSFSAGSKTYTGLTVTEKISLGKQASEVYFDYSIANNIEGSVVVSFTGAQLSGIKDNSKQWNLFWPHKEGKIYEDGISLVRDSTSASARLTASYPGPFSLQLMQLYDESESLFYYVKDATREYKDFNFGCFTNVKQHDYQSVAAADKVSMSSTQYPFVGSGASKNVYQTAIGVSNHGDYYAGSDNYRSFLISSNMVRNMSDYAKNWTGFSVLIGSKYGDRHFASYTSDPAYTINYSSWAEMTNDYGINSTAVLGWHKGGFDSKYPDYQFIEGSGFGESGFKTMTTRSHNSSDAIYPYLNVHIADIASDWASEVDSESGLKNINAAAIKTKGFNSSLDESSYVDYMMQESYGTATTYYAMCPASKLFQKALEDAVTRLRKNGADGLWLDQLMEMPANLCFDKSHGHSTPATAYGEGYKALFGAFEEIMKTQGTGDYLFSCEGVCDAYIEYVDVCGYNWSRKLGARDSDNVNMTPEITRYTMPSKFLGIEGAGTTSGGDDEYARAFVMSDPFLADPYKPSVGSFTSLYASESTYLNGRYIDMKGASCTDENFIYGLTLSEDGKKLIVSYYNFNTEDSSGASITLDPSRIGVSGEIASAVDQFGGSSLSVDGWKVSLPDTKSMGIGSFLVTIQ